DSVLLPFSYILMQDAQYAADFEALFEMCQARNVAVQTIKAIVRAPWGEREHTTATWYEPLSEQADIDKAVHWVLGRPGVFLNTVGDIHVLPKVLDAASRFEKRTTDAEMRALMESEEMAPLFV
ncbi:MAG TPA: aldo/keto reductase, partial [Roseiflexaceae bacterium]|nr:aldo/keto reductase [Roseiflexaceae bacterium]